jgi:4a-hydroxytetrahydrobiopterin dehydratase
MPQVVPDGWTQTDGSLTRTLKRADFVEALAFVLEVGKLAEAANHHPDIKIHHYRQVDISLTSHDAANTLTDKDFALAQKINDLNEADVRLSSDNLRRRFQA